MNDDYDDIGIVRAACLRQLRTEYHAQPALSDILLDAQVMQASRDYARAHAIQTDPADPANNTPKTSPYFATLSRYASAATSALFGFFF